jgi:meiotic recombination protein SPO11
VVEKDAVFTYLCGQRVWDSLPCIIVTGCGYPPLSVRAVIKELSVQLHLPVVGLFDYNPHGIQIMLTYKLGSTRMGLEGHAYAVDLKWLGLHHSDIMEGDTPKVEASALQAWAQSDERVFEAVKSRVDIMGDPHYSRQIALMERAKVKAEIEAIHRISGGMAHLDSLENTITHKIVCKMYF